MRRAAKIDANHGDVVDALRSMGASVQPLHTMGGGVPDLLVGWRGINLLVEVKDGAKRPSARTLTTDQVEWHRAWRGAPVIVVTDVDSAVNAMIGTQW